MRHVSLPTCLDDKVGKLFVLCLFVFVCFCFSTGSLGFLDFSPNLFLLLVPPLFWKTCFCSIVLRWGSGFL